MLAVSVAAAIRRGRYRAPVTRKPPPEFTLAQHDALLAERCAEDDARLAGLGIVLDDPAVLADLWARHEIRAEAERDPSQSRRPSWHRRRGPSPASAPRGTGAAT